jgi:hypothetical protein
MPLPRPRLYGRSPPRALAYCPCTLDRARRCSSRERFLDAAAVCGCKVAPVLGGLCDALIGVGHRTRSGLVKGFQLNDLKSRRRNEFVNLTVQMAAAADPLPYWCHPVLPGRGTAIGRAAMFDEHEATAPSENTFHLSKGL